MADTRLSARHAWYLYDGGNTIIELLVPLSLYRWCLEHFYIDRCRYGWAFGLTSIGFMCSAPFLAVLLTRFRRETLVLRLATVGCAILFAAIGLSPRVLSGDLVLWLAAGSYYLFLLSATIYTAGLRHAASGRELLRTSAMGTGSSYLLGVFFVGIVLLVAPFLGKGSVFPLASGFFLLLAWPLLKEHPILWDRSRQDPGRCRVLRQLLSANPSFARLLVTHSFVAFALVGLLLFLPMHLARVGMGGNTTITILLGGGLAAGLGAFALPRMYQGSPRPVVLFGLSFWTLSTACFGPITTFWALLPVVVINGASTGVVLAALRAALAQSVHPSSQLVAFALVGSVQRLAAALAAVVGACFLEARPLGSVLTPMLAIASAGFLGGFWLFTVSHADRYPDTSHDLSRSFVSSFLIGQHVVRAIAVSVLVSILWAAGWPALYLAAPAVMAIIISIPTIHVWYTVRWRWTMSHIDAVWFKVPVPWFVGEPYIRSQAFPTLGLYLDLAVVTGLIATTGGALSPFAFLLSLLVASGDLLIYDRDRHARFIIVTLLAFKAAAIVAWFRWLDVLPWLAPLHRLEPMPLDPRRVGESLYAAIGIGQALCLACISVVMHINGRSYIANKAAGSDV